MFFSEALQRAKNEHAARPWTVASYLFHCKGEDIARSIAELRRNAPDLFERVERSRENRGDAHE